MRRDKIAWLRFPSQELLRINRRGVGLYGLWSEAFEKREPKLDALLLGKEWLKFQKEIRSLMPPASTLWVNREFFRMCTRHLERSQDWAKADFEIHFSHLAGQLRIQTDQSEFFYPTIGTWLGTMSVSAAALYLQLPKRLTGSFVALRAHTDYLSIGGRSVPAKWTE
jgi:hypothetical protein